MSPTSRRFALASARGLAAAALVVCALAPGAPLAARQARDVGSTPPAPARSAGSGRIAGLVTMADQSATPVRRALVTLASDVFGDRRARTVLTDDDGRFVFTGLPAGRYTVSAAKAAHLSASFGAARPGRPGTSIALDDAAAMTVTLRMARAGVIAGVVRDALGRPMPDVNVLAIDPDDPSPVASRVPFGPGGELTDDRGEYRLHGLAPGEYVVLVVPQGRPDGVLRVRSEAEVDAALAELGRRGTIGSAGAAGSPRPPAPTPKESAAGFAPLYYPGTPAFDNAARVAVDAGDVRTGVDFSVAPVPMVSIEGTVAGGDGQAPANLQMSLSMDGPRLSSVQGPRPILSTPPGPDGRFRYTNIAPGRYRIMARSTAGPPAATGRGGAGGGFASVSGPGGPAGPDLTGVRYALAEVDVHGQDVSGVSLILLPGVTVSGRVVFDAATATVPDDLERIRVSLMAERGTGMSSSGGTVIGNPFNSVRPATIAPDGTFAMPGVAPGTYLLRATVPPDLATTWWLRSALTAGQDLLDVPLVIAGAAPVEPIAVTFADRRSALSGTLQSAAGTPASDYFVVVVPTDRTLWARGSRRVRSVRPGTDGAFHVADLPAGEYRLAALVDVEPRDLTRTSFLDQVAAAGLPIVIREGERTVQDLRIGG